MWSVFLVTLVFVLISPVRCKSTPLPQVLSSGVLFQEVEGASLYDTVFPLIYAYKAPDWFYQRELSASSIPNCSDDRYVGDFGAGGLCPIWYHVARELKGAMDFAMGIQFMTSMVESDVELGAFSCSKVARHFFMERLQNDKFASYLSRWRRCSEGRIWESDLITAYSGKISTVYSTLVKTWMNEFYPKMRTERRVNKGSEVNQKLALAGILYTHYLGLVKRWRRGFQDCKRGLIPDSLLSSKRLQMGLDALGRKIGPHFHFAIPHQGGDISQYFKHRSLADCVYTSDHFYIRVLVPATKVRVAPVELVNIKALPFFREIHGVGQLCMVAGFEKGCLFPTTIEENNDLIIHSTASRVKCDSTNFKLCQIPDPETFIPDKVAICARALLLYDYDPSVENEAAVLINCPLDCTDLRDERFPIIIQTADPFQTIYTITDPKKEDTGLQYKCFVSDNEDPEEHPLPSVPSGTGVLAFVLPCNCSLSSGGPTPLLPGAHCSPEPLLFRVTPFHFFDKEITPQGEGINVINNNTPMPIVNPEDAA